MILLLPALGPFVAKTFGLMSSMKGKAQALAVLSQLNNVVRRHPLQLRPRWWPPLRRQTGWHAEPQLSKPQQQMQALHEGRIELVGGEPKPEVTP